MSRATNSPGIVTRANILQALASATKKLPSLTTPDNCELRKKVASPASRRAVASDDAHGHGSRRHCRSVGACPHDRAEESARLMQNSRLVSAQSLTIVQRVGGSHSATSSLSRCCRAAQALEKRASRLKREIELDRRRPAQIQSTNHRHNYGQLLIWCLRQNHVLRDLGHVRGNGRARRSDGRRSPIGRCQSGRCKPPLYVEFRKDGVPVDPGPWWAVNEGQKVRG